MSLRKYLSALDVEKICNNCALASGLPQESVYDALAETITKMLSQEQKFAGSFQNVGALAGYLQLATVRKAYRQNKRNKRNVPLCSETLLYTKPSPEEYVLDQSEARLRAAVLKQLPKQLNVLSQHKKHLQKLLKVLLSKPEYMLIRRSGQQKGCVAFHVSGLAQELGWSRITVYNRLQQLKDAALQTPHVRPHH